MNKEKFQILLQVLEINKTENYTDESMDLLKHQVLELNDPDLKIALAHLYNSWSNELFYYVDLEDETEELARKALKIIEEATILNPTNHKYFFNWGTHIQRLQKFYSGIEKEKLVYEEIEKYKIALKLNPFADEPLYNWGKCLYDLALTQSGDLAIGNLKEAASLFEKAFCMNTYARSPLLNLGSTFHHLADHDEQNRETWLEKAQSYYKVVVTYFNNVKAIDGLGIISKDLALMKEGEEREKLFSSAIHYHLTAIQKGAEIYNLACTYAAMGDEKNALLFLEKSFQSGEISIEEIINDSDWKKYLETNQLKNMLNTPTE